MDKKKIYKNPDVILVTNVDNHKAVIFTKKEDYIKLLPDTTYAVMQLVDGVSDVNDITKQLEVPKENVVKSLNLLQENDIVSYQEYGINAEIPDKPVTSLTFWFHLTDHCNLTCSYCYISTLETQKNMTNATIDQFSRKIEEVIQQYDNVDEITIKLAGGEPLVAFNHWEKSIQKLIDSLNKTRVRLNIRILTNLTVLTNNIINFSKKNHIIYGVSLDGLDDCHDEYRKFSTEKGSFKIVKKNIERLKHNNIPIAILVTISEKNMQGIVKLVRYLLSENLTFRLADAKGDDINRKELMKVLNNCYDLIDKSIKQGFSIEKKHVLCDLNIISPSKTACPMGVNGAAIYLNGDVFFCHSQFGSNASIGNIFEERDILQIIKSGRYFHTELSNECKSCMYSMICSGGCPLYKTQDNKSPMCGIYKVTIPRIYSIIAKEKQEEL
jgi:uncharacterized protein